MASGDAHRRAPGLSGALTGVFAKQLTSAAILDALRNRRYFATSGSRIIVDARANESVMETQVKTHDGLATLTMKTLGTGPIARAILLHNGAEIKSFQGNGTKSLGATYEVNDLPPGVHWYYWRIEQNPDTPDLPGNLNPAFGHLAWSSPHWVVVD